MYISQGVTDVPRNFYNIEQGEPTTKLLCLISVGYHLELCVVITFHQRYKFIIFFGVHTN